MTRVIRKVLPIRHPARRSDPQAAVSWRISLTRQGRFVENYSPVTGR